MNDEELRARVRESMFRQCHMRGYAAPVDVLMDIGALSKKNYEDWRFGRADTLERVCSMNLSKLSAVLREMYACAKAQNLKPSFCYYKRWGVKKKGQGRRTVLPLRFSRSGDAEIERRYATHYVDEKRIAQLKTMQGTVAEDRAALNVPEALSSQSPGQKQVSLSIRRMDTSRIMRFSLSVFLGGTVNADGTAGL